jgi:hypothetical protein
MAMRSTLVWIVAAAVLVLGSCADDDGPGRIEARSFVQLGTGVVDLEPLWLDDAGALESAIQSLTAADANGRNLEVDEAVDALETPAAEGTRGAAFVLTGCTETGAELTIEGSTITATPTGGDENTNCVAQAYFLATFDIPDDAIPQGAHLE